MAKYDENELKKKIQQARDAGIPEDVIKQRVKSQFGYDMVETKPKTTTTPQPQIKTQSTKQTSKEEKSRIEKFEDNWLVGPAVKYGGSVLEAVRQLANLSNPAYRKAMFDPDNLTPEEAEEVIKLATPKFMSENQLKRTVEKPVETTAKNIAGAASYVIPAGKGLKTAIALGGVTGGLRAYSEEDATLGSVAGGVVGGGVAGGVINKAVPAIKSGFKTVGKVGSRLTGLEPRELMQTAIPIKPSAVSQAQRRGLDVYKVLLDEGIEGDRSKIITTLETKGAQYAKQLNTALKTASKKGAKVEVAPIIKSLEPIKEMVSSAAVTGKETLLKQLDDQITILKSLGKYITPLEAQQQKEAISQFIKWNVQNPTLSSQVLQKVRWGFKDAIEKKVKDVGVRELNQKLGAFQIAGDALQDLGERELNLGLKEIFGLPSTMAAFAGPGYLVGGPTGAALGTSLAVPIWANQTLARSSPAYATKVANFFYHLQGLKDPTGTLSVVGKLMSGITNKVTVLTTGKVGEVVGGKTETGVPAVPTELAPSPEATTPDVPETPVGLDTEGAPSLPKNVTGYTVEELTKGYAVAVGLGKAGSGAASTLKKLLDIEKEYQKSQVSEKGEEMLRNAQTNVSKLKELYGIGTKDSLSRGDSTVGIEGMLSGAGVKVKKMTDQEYVDRLARYNNMRTFAVGLINQARGAGVLNGGEYEIMIANMPNENSSEAQAQAWFDDMDDILNRLRGQGINTVEEIPTNPYDVNFESDEGY